MLHLFGRGAWPMPALALVSSCLFFQVQSAGCEGGGGKCDACEAACVADVSSLTQLRASPRAHSKSHSVSLGPGHVGLTEDHEGSGTCVVTVAIGAAYIETAKLTGVSKRGYADKWNYTYLPYMWETPDEFRSWAHSTELGSRIAGGGDLRMIHPIMKYLVMHDALTAKRCRHALWLDADAVILNSDIRADFSLPSAVMGSGFSGKPYAMYTVMAAPRGMPTGTDTGIDWCSLHSPCTSFKTFAACLNTGVFMLDDSMASLDYMSRVVSGAVNNISLTHDCSTGDNPWGADQCLVAHHDWDQCISGCVWKQEKRDDEDRMPDGVLCVEAEAKGRPHMMQLLKSFMLNITEHIRADTFVVNIADTDNATPMLLQKLSAAFPHTKIL